jgi:group I intron endonuclease
VVKKIYKITNKINNKIYIGQTKQELSVRFRQHLDGMGFGKKMPIHLALKKYGKDNFIMEEICSCLDQVHANYLEAYFIDKFNSLAPNGYNVDFNTTHIKDNPYLIEEYKNSSAVQSIESETEKSEHNLSTRPQYPYLLWMKIKSLYEKGNSPIDINNLLKADICPNRMVKKLRALGCDTSSKARNKIRGQGRYQLSKEEKTNILSDFRKGLTCVQLERKYSRAARPIKGLLVEAGLYSSKDKKICRTLG